MPVAVGEQPVGYRRDPPAAGERSRWRPTIAWLLVSDMGGAMRHRAGRVRDCFREQAPPSWGYLVWVSVWFLVVLGAGLLSFQRREL
jgi:hypothetical protein